MTDGQPQIDNLWLSFSGGQNQSFSMFDAICVIGKQDSGQSMRAYKYCLFKIKHDVSVITYMCAK